MERLRIKYNVITELYNAGELRKEVYEAMKQEIIEELVIHRQRSKKRVLSLDSFILLLETN